MLCELHRGSIHSFLQTKKTAGVGVTPATTLAVNKTIALLDLDLLHNSQASSGIVGLPPGGGYCFPPLPRISQNVFSLLAWPCRGLVYVGNRRTARRVIEHKFPQTTRVTSAAAAASDA